MSNVLENLKKSLEDKEITQEEYDNYLDDYNESIVDEWRFENE